MWDPEIRFVYSWGKVKKETKIWRVGEIGKLDRLKIDCANALAGSSPAPATNRHK